MNGFYYLHTNGELIYEPDHDGTGIAGAVKYPFCIAVWPVFQTNRSNAWDILVEALAAGADKAQIDELAEKWGCNDEDAMVYASYHGFRLSKDGDQFCATRSDFIDLQNSPAGFGATALEAISALAKELGYRPEKVCRKSFASLVTDTPTPLTQGAQQVSSIVTYPASWR